MLLLGDLSESSSLPFSHIVIELLFACFLHVRVLIVFQTWLSKSKSPQIFRTLLSILSDHNTAIVWMISMRPQILQFSRHLTKLFRTAPSVFSSLQLLLSLPSFTTFFFFFFFFFFTFLARSTYSFLFSFSFTFTLWSAWSSKSSDLNGRLI